MTSLTNAARQTVRQHDIACLASRMRLILGKRLTLLIIYKYTHANRQASYRLLCFGLSESRLRYMYICFHLLQNGLLAIPRDARLPQTHFIFKLSDCLGGHFRMYIVAKYTGPRKSSSLAHVSAGNCMRVCMKSNEVWASRPLYIRALCPRNCFQATQTRVFC